MTPQEVVAHFGGKEKSVYVAARRLKLTPQIIYKWMKDGRVPQPRQAMIQIATRGRLRCDGE